MEPWEIWLIMFLLTTIFAKSRLLLYDLEKYREVCHFTTPPYSMPKCKFYKKAAVLDAVFIIIFLAMVLLLVLK